MLRDKYLLIRKVFHLLSVFILVAYVLLPQAYRNLFLISVLLLAVIVEYARLVFHMKIPFFWRLWERDEAKQLGGEFFLFVGIVLALKLFPFIIGLIASLCVIFGDTVATIVGRYYGKRKIFLDKTLEGFLTSFFVCFVLISFFAESFFFSFLLALFSSLVELFAVGIDDNLLVPFLTGLFAYFLTLVFPHALSFI